MTKFMMMVLCFFVAFHLVAYYALIRAMFITPKGKILAGIAVILHFLVTLFFAYCLLFRIEIPHFVYALLSLTVLSAVLFFTAGIINIIFLIVFRKDAKKQSLCARIAFAIGGLCVIGSFLNAIRMPSVTHTTIYLPNLQKETTMLMMSDLHLSNLISVSKTQKIIDLANAQNADTMVLVGDIFDSSQKIMQKFLPELRRLNAKNGVYLALGNHEFLFGIESNLKQIKSLENITPLVNANKIIDNNFNLIGISDLSGRAWNIYPPDIKEAMQGVDSNLPAILLSHQPNIIKTLEADLASAESSKKIDLILSGHTHGGQIFPFSIGAYIANPFLYGLKTINGTQLYISQGAHLAVTYGRFLSRAEINLITLKKEQK